MKKRITLLTTVILCFVCLIAGVSSAGIVQKIQSELRPDFTIIIDGEKKVFRNVNGDVVEPILYNGSTYLPVRAIGELMGKTVYWYENEKTIELKSEQSTVTDADVIVPSRDENPANSRPAASGGDPLNVSVTEERAKEIACQNAGVAVSDVTFTEFKLDRDDGIMVYEMEFIYGRTEYSADVRASDGKIISWEVETR